MPGTGVRRLGVGDYTLPGLWVALVLACLSFTPSLLPRPAAFQGAVVGIDAALGYGLGVLGAFVWREFADRGPRQPSERTRRAWRVVAVVALVGATLVGRRWHVQASRIVDAEPESAWATLLVPLVGGAVFVLLVALGRAIGDLYGRVSTWLARRMGERAARATGLLALVSVTVLLASGVLWDASMRFADRVYATLDGSTPDGATQPSTGLRSGGHGSLVEWDSLGREGRSFTGRGPTSAEISAFHDGEPALDPIRIYAGLSSADDTEQRADLAVRDLWRAGGFERESLLVVTATGTGWVEPSAAGSFEYLTRGDSAVVSMQYSHLPSWLSFLVDQEKAREAGRGLFDAVYERWSRMPPEERPRLFVFGESLGSFGGETAFSGEFDLRNRLDGALLRRAAQLQPALPRVRRRAGLRQHGGGAGLPCGAHDPLHDPAGALHRAGVGVAGHPGPLHAARVGPRHLVEPRPDPEQARLARRAARSRRPRGHPLDPARHLLAGLGRPRPRLLDHARSRAQLQRGARGRLGGRPGDRRPG